MTDIMERLRHHVNARLREQGNPEIKNGAWLMMLDAADEIELLRLRALTTWQPIETMPFKEFADLWWQNGDEGYRIPNCHARDEETFIEDSGNIISSCYITHWMPEPEPPEGVTQ